MNLEPKAVFLRMLIPKLLLQFLRDGRTKSGLRAPDVREECKFPPAGSALFNPMLMNNVSIRRERGHKKRLRFIANGGVKGTLRSDKTWVGIYPAL